MHTLGVCMYMFVLMAMRLNLAGFMHVRMRELLREQAAHSIRFSLMVLMRFCSRIPLSHQRRWRAARALASVAC